MHSKMSDGALEPGEMVLLARRKGISCISLTDHDSVKGISGALAAGNEQNVEVIPGIEISCNYKDGEIHILGYFIHWQAPLLAEYTDKVTAYRRDRGAMMVERLNKLGYTLTMEDVSTQAGSVYIGRPHVAKALVRKKYVRSIEEAFIKLLSRGQPGYVEQYHMTPFEAVELVLACGGVPVLAHPGIFTSAQGVPEELIGRLIAAGLMGIEVYHIKHGILATGYYLAMAQSKKLLITGGSDCHGGINGMILVGKILLPYKYVSRIKDAWKEFYGK
ncbi:MAG: PHP domain-containing protein [Bacillota bacterium]